MNCGVFCAAGADTVKKHVICKSGSTDSSSNAVASCVKLAARHQTIADAEHAQPSDHQRSTIIHADTPIIRRLVNALDDRVLPDVRNVRGVTGDEDAIREREFELHPEVRAHVGARQRRSRVRGEDVLAVALGGAAKHPFGPGKLL